MLVGRVVSVTGQQAAGEPELILAGRMGDDFYIDEENEVIYLTTHRQNTTDRVSMDPGKNSGFTVSVAGDPYTEQLIGPSSVAWGKNIPRSELTVTNDHHRRV